MRNLIKTLTSDMSRPPKPVQENKSLSAKQFFPFVLRYYTFPFSFANLSLFMKSCGLWIKIIILNKIMCFTKQSYERLTESFVLLSKFMISNVRTYCWLNNLRNTQGNIWNEFRKYIWKFLRNIKGTSINIYDIK